MSEETFHYPFEPSLQASDLGLFASTSWGEIDELASSALGYRCFGIPSVRVGICWAFEFLHYSRHRDHVLVPRFVGRCILNAFSRYALPVEAATAHTRAAISVDQFGFRQAAEDVAAECRARGYVLIEDSPYGVADRDSLSSGVFARFIGLSKVLPVAQGALLLTDDPEFLDFIRRKRQDSSPWALFSWMLMAWVRSRSRAASYTPVADLAYEMYLEMRGGSRFQRGNLRRAILMMDAIGREQADRLAFLTRLIPAGLLLPDIRRLTYVVPYVTDDTLENEIAAIFLSRGFDPQRYHVDIARNLFSASYVKAFLFPMNPRIPRAAFERLVQEVSDLVNSLQLRETVADL